MCAYFNIYYSIADNNNFIASAESFSNMLLTELVNSKYVTCLVMVVTYLTTNIINYIGQ